MTSGGELLLAFDQGTLTLVAPGGAEVPEAAVPPGFVTDPRAANRLRAPAT